nr:hypothetical protein [Ochrobactrum sp. CM-21-5]
MNADFVLVGLLSLMAAGTASAASCEQSFKVDGIPLVTAVNYSTTQTFSGVKSSMALQRLAQAVASEAFQASE